MLRRGRWDYSSSSSSSNGLCFNNRRGNLVFTRSNPLRYDCSSSSSSCHEVKHCPEKQPEEIVCFEAGRRGRNIRGDFDEYICLIQSVICQGVASSTKLAQGFAHEVIRSITSGVTNIIKTAENQVSDELNRLETRILVLVRKVSDEIQNEVDDLITATNNDLLDSLVRLLKETNLIINNEVQKLAAQPIVVQPTPIDLLATVAIVNSKFADLLGSILLLFRKVTSNELSALNKLLVEKKNGLLAEITQELNNFRTFLNTVFGEIQANEAKLITSIFDHSARRLLVELDNILSQIGQNIISVIKGCNTAFRPPVCVNAGAICAPLGYPSFR